MQPDHEITKLSLADLASCYFGTETFKVQYQCLRVENKKNFQFLCNFKLEKSNFLMKYSYMKE